MPEFEVIRYDPNLNQTDRPDGKKIIIAPGTVKDSVREIVDTDLSVFDYHGKTFERSGEPEPAVLKYLGYFAVEGRKRAQDIYEVNDCVYLPNGTRVTAREIDFGVDEGYDLERYYDPKNILSTIEPEEEEKPQAIAVEATASQDPGRWGDTSSPERHDRSNFRYLVYAINAYHRENLAGQLPDLTKNYEHDPAWGDQSIDLSSEPERVAERVSLSMSLIDQGHRATWGAAGLILEVPKQNIIATSTEEAGTLNWHRPWLEQYKAQNKDSLMEPAQLLDSTSVHDYNEVLAFATGPDGEKVKVVGFFKKVDERGDSINPSLARQLSAKARILGLPVVKIPKEPEY